VGSLGHYAGTVPDQPVGLDELASWVARCEAGLGSLPGLTDDDLKRHYTVMLITRMLVFSHEPPAGQPRDPAVDTLVARLGPCLDAAYQDADMRGWDPRVLREAARLELSRAAEPVDPVAIFRTS